MQMANAAELKICYESHIKELDEAYEKGNYCLVGDSLVAAKVEKLLEWKASPRNNTGNINYPMPECTSENGSYNTYYAHQSCIFTCDGPDSAYNEDHWITVCPFNSEVPVSDSSTEEVQKPTSEPFGASELPTTSPEASVLDCDSSTRGDDSSIGRIEYPSPTNTTLGAAYLGRRKCNSDRGTQIEENEMQMANAAELKICYESHIKELDEAYEKGNYCLVGDSLVAAKVEKLLEWKASPRNNTGNINYPMPECTSENGSYNTYYAHQSCIFTCDGPDSAYNEDHWITVCPFNSEVPVSQSVTGAESQ